MKWYKTLEGKDLDRFEGYVPDSYDRNGCLIWQGKIQSKGRCQFYFDGSWYVASRVMYSLHHRVKVPDRYEDGRRCVIAHTCHNPACIHPEHLVMTDQKGNIKMSYDDGRIPVGRKRWNSLLTEHAVVQCRKLYCFQGKTQKELAKMYGVAKQTISSVIIGTRWGHVKEGLNYRKIEPTEGTFKHTKTEDGVMHLQEITG